MSPLVPPEQLGRRTARGALVVLAGQGARIVLQLGGLAVLARMLGPTAYGLLAIALIVIGVGEIFRDFGLTTAAIQAKTLSKEQRAGLFWLNVIIGCCLAAGVVAGAPVVALIFDRPELTSLIRVLGLSFVITGLATQHRASLTRSLRFTAIAVADITAQAGALTVAIVMAATGWGYWALAGQQLTQVTIAMVIVIVAGRWLPGRLRRGVGLRGFVGRGLRLVGTQVVGYLGNNVDSIALGLSYPPAQVGQYTRAFQLLMNPLNSIRSPATSVALPVLSRMQDEPDRTADYVVRAQTAFGMTVVPGLALVSGLAPAVVTVMLGSQWTASGPVLSWLCVGAALQLLAFVGLWVYLSRGLNKQLLRYTLVTSCLTGVCVVIGSLFSVTSVAVGFAIAAAIEWPLSLWWLGRITSFPVRRLMLGGLRIVAFAIPIALAGHLVTFLVGGWPAGLQLLTGFGAAVVVYLLEVAVVRPWRRDVRGVMGFVRAAFR